MSFVVEMRELAAADGDLLQLFYTEIYEREFPDPDERESLANIARYLALKDEGWYGRNNYHVVLACRGNTVLGGCILDYLEQPNAGVLEFLFTVTAERGQGVGRALLAEAERLATIDASRAGRGLAWIAAEMNDPFVATEVPDNIDPFVRARIWHGWGFGALDCPYVQPALSAGQRPAEGLLLIAKPIAARWRDGVPSSLVRCLVAEYLRWAMRIEAPEANAQFGALAGWLDRRSTVDWTPLARYIGESGPEETSAPAFDVLELRDASQPEFAAAIDVYRRAFDSPSTAVEPASFVRGLRRYTEPGYRYHLWAVRGRGDGSVAGMASFFGFAGMGFGGYVVFEGALRGAGCLRPLLAKMEQQLIADALGMHGWLIECESASTAEVFRRCGFFALDVGYTQPDLPGSAEGGTPPLILMYRQFGRVYGPPRLTSDELLAGLAEVLRHVYRIAEPQAHPTLRAVAARIGNGLVPVIVELRAP
jgi:GNAT superfamily N-acetyltransferase